MRKKVTVEELAAILGMTIEGVLDWTLPNTKMQNFAGRCGISLQEAMLQLDSRNKINVSEFLRWSETISKNRGYRGLPKIEPRFINFIKEGDDNKIKRLVELNTLRLQINEERKKILNEG